MAGLTGRDFLDLPQKVAELLQVVPVPRTHAVLTSLQAGSAGVTFITARVSYHNDIVNMLPAVVIDINPNQPVRTLYEGTRMKQGIPLTLALFTPNLAYQEGLSAEERVALDQLADEDIKTMYGDIVSVLNEAQGRGIGRDLKIEDQSPGIAYYDMALGENTQVQARMGEIWVCVWRDVRGH